jgi:hypothetical protein
LDVDSANGRSGIVESRASLRFGGASSKPGLAPAGDSLSLASPRESKQREGDPMVRVPSLRCGQPAVLAENGVELDSLRSESLALIRFRLRSSAQPDGWGKVANSQNPRQNSNPECRKRAALPARESQQTVMFARERSTRGQMKSPSLAQRGEGGARGESGELKLLPQASRGRSVMPGTGLPARHHGCEAAGSAMEITKC